MVQVESFLCTCEPLSPPLELKIPKTKTNRAQGFILDRIFNACMSLFIVAKLLFFEAGSPSSSQTCCVAEDDLEFLTLLLHLLTIGLQHALLYLVCAMLGIELRAPAYLAGTLPFEVHLQPPDSFMRGLSIREIKENIKEIVTNLYSGKACNKDAIKFMHCCFGNFNI